MKIIIPTTEELNNPEDAAMLQALYSRSPESVVSHLEKVKTTGSGKFMQNYYINYGHASIGQGGEAQPIFIEGVSMLAAKAIQDSPLYRGQESSSRYMDWSVAPFYIPDESDFNNDEGENDYTDRFYNPAYKILRDFYIELVTGLPHTLKEKYPIKSGEKPEVYENAIKARCFDTARGYLPAGALTQLSLKTDFDNLNDRLLFMFNHPLVEVRETAELIHKQVINLYPNSIRKYEWFHDGDKYGFMQNNDFYYDNADNSMTILNGQPIIGFHPNFIMTLDFQKELLKDISDIPKGFKFLPPRTDMAVGDIRVQGIIDFGSFRDLQRQRRMLQVMPLLTSELGMHPWYINSLEDEGLMNKARKITSQVYELEQTFVSELKSNEDKIEMAQYILPMATNVNYDLSMKMSQLLYVSALRSSETVHPTLRQEIIGWAKTVKAIINFDLPNVDMRPDVWSIKRGSQTITQK